MLTARSSERHPGGAPHPSSAQPAGPRRTGVRRRSCSRQPSPSQVPAYEPALVGVWGLGALLYAYAVRGVAPLLVGLGATVMTVLTARRRERRQRAGHRAGPGGAYPAAAVCAGWGGRAARPGVRAGRVRRPVARAGRGAGARRPVRRRGPLRDHRGVRPRPAQWALPWALGVALAVVAAGLTRGGGSVGSGASGHARDRRGSRPASCCRSPAPDRSGGRVRPREDWLHAGVGVTRRTSEPPPGSRSWGRSSGQHPRLTYLALVALVGFTTFQSFRGVRRRSSRARGC